jgi:hypothetical protein
MLVSNCYIMNIINIWEYYCIIKIWDYYKVSQYLNCRIVVLSFEMYQKTSYDSARQRQRRGRGVRVNEQERKRGRERREEEAQGREETTQKNKTFPLYHTTRLCDLQRACWKEGKEDKPKKKKVNRVRRPLNFVRRHLFTSSPLALAFSAASVSA